jgi:ribosomal protein S12 methylthiotransferase accessory factor YcaO
VARSVFVGECFVPAERMEDMEAAAGKGFSEEEALLKTVAEAAERFGAWQANDVLPVATDAVRSHGLPAFHPFGDEYHAYLAAGAPPLPLAAVTEYVSGETVAVPRCLLPFPFLARDGCRRPTRSETTGLAAHPTLVGALTRGVREVLERHDLYTGLLHKAPGWLLALTWARGLSCDLEALIGELQLHGDVWLVRYPSALCPIVHAFLRCASTGRVARGTASGLSLAEAARDSLLELVQIYGQSLRRPPVTNPEPFVRWSLTEVADELTEYLHALPHESRMDPGGGTSTDADEAGQLADIADGLRRGGSELLWAALPCPIESWWVVRVLVPGLATNTHASESAGGRRVANPTFPHGVPS